MIEYKMHKGIFTKDGHTMFIEDVLKDLKRMAYLEENRCLLYVDPRKDCVALRERNEELNK